MAITRVNGVVKNHQRADRSRKGLRRKENKRVNRDKRNLTLTSKHLADNMRKIWDSESRQNRRWVIAHLEAGIIGGEAGIILHRWIKAKSPAEQGQLRKASDIKLGTDAERQALKEAWFAFESLKKEREEAMGQWGNGVTVRDWWSQGPPIDKMMKEEDEAKHAEEAEEGGFGDGTDAMSVNGGWNEEDEEDEEEEDEDEDDDDDEGGVELEPPEPISPMEYSG